MPFFGISARSLETERPGSEVHLHASDAELAAASLSGDDEAFAALLHRHLPAVYAFAYRYVGNSDDANDVAQETFLKAWKHMKSFDPKRSFKTWILTITKNTSLDFLKKKRPVLFSKIEEGEGDLDAFLAPHVESPAMPDELFLRKQTKSDVASVLGRLAEGYRTVLTLRYEQGLKFREIAEVLGEPIDTVKSKHRRGLMLLRQMMAE